MLVKKIHVPNATKRQIEKFTHDVAALKHSRHENVVLFMGVCSKPPDLAVVTRYDCTGGVTPYHTSLVHGCDIIMNMSPCH